MILRHLDSSQNFIFASPEKKSTAAYDNKNLVVRQHTSLLQQHFDITVSKPVANSKMAHVCKLPHKDSISSLFTGVKSKLRQRLLKYVLISETNPLSTKYFRSHLAINREKKRQVKSGYLSVIHPFSKLRENYDKWLLFFYIWILIFKPLEACILWESSSKFVKELSIITMFLTWIDIVMNCFTGYYIKSNKSVELGVKKICKKYIFGPFFLIDSLGSISIFTFPVKPPLIVCGIHKIFCLLRGIRIISVLQLWVKLFSFKKYKTMTFIFTICCLNIFGFVLHFFICLLLSVTWIVRVDFGFGVEADSPLKNEISYSVYNEYLFKTSAFLLGISLPPQYFNDIKFTEEYLTAVIIYVIGKLMVISTWITLVLIILESRSRNIKFQKVMNQLENYMKQRHLPLGLRKRLTQHYEFKYQSNYFKVNFLNFFLTGGLKKDIDYELCKSLINSVSILKELSLNEVRDIVQVLIPEIFLPGDVIIQAGTYGDSLYFLSSGTVAVYTHSGREIRHLQDGAYFGELAIVLKSKSKRTATVVAVEISQIYRMKKSDFNRTLLKHQEVYKKIAANAQTRLTEISLHEELHKKYLFELNLLD